MRIYVRDGLFMDMQLRTWIPNRSFAQQNELSSSTIQLLGVKKVTEDVTMAVVSRHRPRPIKIKQIVVHSTTPNGNSVTGGAGHVSNLIARAVRQTIIFCRYLNPSVVNKGRTWGVNVVPP